MNFDWTTFVLEILNFVILVWIMKRFLYGPVLAILDARRKRLLDEAAKAETLQRQAAELKTTYESRLADWDKERALRRQELDGDLAHARTAGMETLRKQLADAQAKARARDEALTAARDAALLRQAAANAYGAAAAMLTRLASPELTDRILDLFIEDMTNLPEDQLTALRHAASALGAHTKAELASAHMLGDAAHQRVATALAAVVGQSLPLEFRVVPELTAGLRVRIGECELHANLADELAYFRRQGDHG